MPIFFWPNGDGVYDWRYERTLRKARGECFDDVGGSFGGRFRVLFMQRVDPADPLGERGSVHPSEMIRSNSKQVVGMLVFCKAPAGFG